MFSYRILLVILLKCGIIAVTLHWNSMMGVFNKALEDSYIQSQSTMPKSNLTILKLHIFGHSGVWAVKSFSRMHNFAGL